MKYLPLLLLLFAIPVQSQTKLEVIAACLVLESGGEITDGKIAVANVFHNRAGKRDINAFYKVVTKRYQFSCFNAVTVDKTKTFADVVKKAKQRSSWKICHYIVKQELLGNNPMLVPNCKHYYAAHGPNKIKPPYWHKGQKYKDIGNHRFVFNVN